MPDLKIDTLTSAPAVRPDSMTTAAVDSVNIPSPFLKTSCRDIDAPVKTSFPLSSLTVGRIPFSNGLQGIERPLLPGYNTGVMCLLIITFLFLAANFRHYSTFVKTFTQDLWKVRNRSNIFDDHTMSETRVLASFIMVLCVSEGIILYSAIAPHIRPAPIFASIGLITAIALIFYLLQIAAYRTVGYVFTSSQNTIQWIRGFRASQSLLGITLVIPALIVLFNPGLDTAITAISLGLYILARIIFIFKGFRIFYINSFSLIYFILYLCTLEIIPPIIMCKTAVFVTLHF